MANALNLKSKIFLLYRWLENFSIHLCWVRYFIACSWPLNPSSSLWWLLLDIAVRWPQFSLLHFDSWLKFLTSIVLDTPGMKIYAWCSFDARVRSLGLIEVKYLLTAIHVDFMTWSGPLSSIHVGACVVFTPVGEISALVSLMSPVCNLKLETPFFLDQIWLLVELCFQIIYHWRSFWPGLCFSLRVFMTSLAWIVPGQWHIGPSSGCISFLPVESD